MYLSARVHDLCVGHTGLHFCGNEAFDLRWRSPYICSCGLISLCEPLLTVYRNNVPQMACFALLVTVWHWSTVLILSPTPSRLKYSRKSNPRGISVYFLRYSRFQRSYCSTHKGTVQCCICKFRAFGTRDSRLYIELYRSLVELRIIYCSPVWRPYLR